MCFGHMFLVSLEETAELVPPNDPKLSDSERGAIAAWWSKKRARGPRSNSLQRMVAGESLD